MSSIDFKEGRQKKKSEKEREERDSGWLRLNHEFNTQ